ncbi:DUF2950 family protein [Mesorhizobium sp. VNQ89]|uniref:DUF2950 family protein n=1 Tax=Mesorhizobium quangtriensis TaxID=3157709 RepID=UPI0032B728C9
MPKHDGERGLGIRKVQADDRYGHTGMTRARRQCEVRSVGLLWSSEKMPGDQSHNREMHQEENDAITDPAKIKDDESTAAALALIKEGASKKLSLEGGADRRTVLVGERLWPLPFPIVKWEDGKWAFDTYAGLQEIVNRLVGENELQTIATMRAYVDAQEDYASVDRDGDGVEEFAQKLVSSAGMTDGLYWPTDATNGESPAGDLDQSELDDAAKGEGYFGYKYKILTGQGDNIAGGAYDYVINGNMIAGFGLIAWPAKYGETGVKTLAVNQHGIVYEIDLGPATDQIVKDIDTFNPDDSWTVVAD